VSNAIRYDAFLVDHLARELNAELAGKNVTALQFDSGEQRVLIDVGDIRIVWELHATKGMITRTAPLYPLSDSAILPKKARVKSIRALGNERVVVIELTGEKKENATFSVVVELLTNQWNAFALDHADKVLRVLKLRETGRVFRRGQNYQPPEHPEVDRVPFRSPINAQLDDEQFARMLEEAPLPALIGDQPYPHHMWREDAQNFSSLLAAFAALAGGDSIEVVVRELERRQRAAGKKLERLQAELANAEVTEKSKRASADLLLAYAATVSRGVSRVTLPGFDGGSVDIELDPKLSAIDNAQAIYEEARKYQRALKRMPSLIEQAERQVQKVESLLERARRGELSDVDLKQIAERPVVKQQQPHAERLPYRRYQTSGGLEVRVGRNAKSNDELTLHHSSPRDIWLHARHVGGAHVVLRWHDAEANPSQRDIMEAATLAAIHSGARTSRTVPVDYTRRKYVRKPRRSPPGTVMIERAKTIFVEPSAELEAKLRIEGGA
jgi:predicted ribosome quality control (RQC) complex YloA/Tae2 family protein